MVYVYMTPDPIFEIQINYTQYVSVYTIVYISLCDVKPFVLPIINSFVDTAIKHS